MIEAASYVHYKVGNTLYSYYLSDYYGVNPSNGEALWVTEDGSLTNNYNQARKYYAGSPEPKLIGGFNTTLAWKGLQLSAFFEYKVGNYVCILNEYSYLNSDGKQMDMNQMGMMNMGMPMMQMPQMGMPMMQMPMQQPQGMPPYGYPPMY